MPKNFPEIWEARVRQTLLKGEEDTFLNGISELPGDVIEMGAENLIHISTTSFSPDVLINNSTYPLALQEYNDDEVIVKLDKFQTKPTKISDDQIIGANYKKIDAITQGHTNAILVNKYRKAIHAIAPTSNATKTPIVNIADSSGKFTYNDIVALKDKCDIAQWPESGRRLVLCTKHYNEMLLDRSRFGELLVNHKAGKAAPVIAGFEVLNYISNPIYTNGTKKIFGQVTTPADKVSSVAFVKDNIVKKVGLSKQYFSEAKNDPTSQANLLNYRHYFIALPAENKYIAAII